MRISAVSFDFRVLDSDTGIKYGKLTKMILKFVEKLLKERPATFTMASG